MNNPMQRPTLVFEPPSIRRVRPVAALWRLREFSDLFVTLSVHRLRVRYAQSRLGLLWALIQPVAMMLVFTLMFTVLRTAPGGEVPFPLFAYSALLPWTTFASGLANASASLTSNASLLSKVYFPREILPLTYIMVALVVPGAHAQREVTIVDLGSLGGPFSQADAINNRRPIVGSSTRQHRVHRIQHSTSAARSRLFQRSDRSHAPRSLGSRHAPRPGHTT
jgi:hypothetical protein